MWGTALVVALAICAQASASDFAVAPITGAAIVTQGKFTNIYLYPDPASETWDQHLVTVGSPNASSETSEAIDAFVSALASSHYWDVLSQYKAGLFGSGGPIRPPSFLGSEKTISKCVNAAMKDAKSGLTLEYGTLRSFANL